MSCYETHKGIIKKVDLDGKDVRKYLASKIEDSEYTFDESYPISDIIWDNNLEDTFIFVNKELYEWLEHEVKWDEEDDYCELTELKDGSIKVNAQFYNGGVCIEDMLESYMTKLERANKKELSADEIINVACKWLDNHHSDYIVSMQYGSIVSGACQTDLRAFLNKAKTMNYEDAINATKNESVDIK